MMHDPFIIKDQASHIKDSEVNSFSLEVDGDIIIADSYRKKIKHEWKNTLGLRLLAVFGAAFFLILFGKLYYLQIARGAKYYGAAEGNRIKNIPILPARGVIFDKNSKRLAYNVPDFALVVAPAYLPKDQADEDEIFISIAKILSVEHFDLVEEFSHIPRTSSSQIELSRSISQQQAVSLAQYTQQWDAVSLIPIQTRAYEIKQPLSHVLGYTGKISEKDYNYFTDQGYMLVEHVGKTGLEKQYEHELRGAAGVQLVEVDSNNNPTRELDKKDSIVGNNLYLNINADLQEFVWEQMEQMVDKRESPGASVVVLDPRSGKVRALASFPGFDNEEFARGISSVSYSALLKDEREPLFNRSIAGEYASGSTIKLVIGAAALEENIISRYDAILSTGGIDVNSYWFPDWKYGGHGQTNIIHALAESVNTYFYAIGGGYENIDGLGVKVIADYGREFGLASKTYIDLPSEASGFLPSKEWKQEAKNERWFLGDTYHLAIGQGDILVTPLQVANFTSVVANGGTLYAPQAVDRIGRDYDTARAIEPQVLNEDFVDAQNINVIQQGLRAAVEYGTARSLSALPIKVAGKTGTAQFSSTKKPHAWFTGYAPYRNPEIVVTVLVEQGEAGDLSATPIAKKIFEWYFENDLTK